MYIREFMHRFSSLMIKEAKAHLDELGEIVGDGSVDWAVNETQSKKGRNTPDIPLVSWVSAKCIRSVVLGLLGIYAEDASGPLKKARPCSQLSFPMLAITVSIRVSESLSRKSRVVRQT